MSRRSGVAAPLLLGMIAACGGEPAVDPTLPPRPDLPDGWRTVITDERDLVVAVPPEFVVVGTTGAISGYPEPDAPESASVTIIGPMTHELRPSQTIEEWIDASNWLTGQREGAELGAVQREELLLPSGPALELSASYTVDGRDAWTILYAIQVAGDHSVVRFGGEGPPPDALPEELALIRDVLVFPSR